MTTTSNHNNTSTSKSNMDQWLNAIKKSSRKNKNGCLHSSLHDCRPPRYLSKDHRRQSLRDLLTKDQVITINNNKDGSTTSTCDSTLSKSSSCHESCSGSLTSNTSRRNMFNKTKSSRRSLRLLALEGTSSHCGNNSDNSQRSSNVFQNTHGNNTNTCSTSVGCATPSYVECLTVQETWQTFKHTYSVQDDHAALLAEQILFFLVERDNTTRQKLGIKSTRSPRFAKMASILGDCLDAMVMAAGPTLLEDREDFEAWRKTLQTMGLTSLTAVGQVLLPSLREAAPEIFVNPNVQSAWEASIVRAWKEWA